MRRDQLLKLVLTIAGSVLFFSMKVHAADLSQIHIKAAKEPQKYEVCDTAGKNCKEQNAAEATVALLQGGKRVFIVTRKEQELQQTGKGLGFTAKK